MDNSKYVDLHKIAAIFRGIQEEEYAKKEVDVSDTMEDAVEEDNAFNTAAAKAALAGDKEFSFNGKKYPVKMSKEEAKKLLDSEINSEEPVDEAPFPGEYDYTDPKYMDADGTPKSGPDMSDPEVGHVMAVFKKYPEDVAKMKQTGDIDYGSNLYQALFSMYQDEMPYGTQKARDGDPGQWIFDKLDDLGLIEGKEKDTEEVLKKGMEDEIADTIKDKIEDEDKTDEAEVSEEPQGEQVAVMSTDTLSQILKLAGMKQVSDADINQPEASAEEVEEYANSPEEEYADTDFMTNKLAGGVNRPKKFPNVGNQGHNDLVQRLTKAYNEQKD
jgi:hypothetical protein